jgi:hypothetical protein
MHDHNVELVASSSSGISSMTVMWILMGIMAVHHLLMWREMKKMKNKKECGCNV